MISIFGRKYSRNLILFALFVIIESVIYFFLVQNYREESIGKQKKESSHSLNFLQDMIKASLHDHDYSNIQIVIKSWYDSHKSHLGQLNLTAKNGFEILNIKSSNLRLVHTYTDEIVIKHSNDKELRLHLVINLDDSYSRVFKFSIDLFLIMLFSSVAVGYMMYLSNKKNTYSLSLRRRQNELDDLLLELVQEVEKRKGTEIKLISNNKFLEEAQEIALIGSWEYDFKNNIFVGSPEFFNILKLPYKNDGKVSLKDLSKVITDFAKLQEIADNLKVKEEFDVEFLVNDQFTKIILKTIRIIGKKIGLDNMTESVLKGVIQDITEKKKYEREITSANNDLKEMLHIVAHELQTPLVTMEGFSSLILENFIENLDEQMIYYLQRINTNALNMKKLINSILDISRLNTVKYPAERFSTYSMINDLKQEITIISKSEVMINIRTFPKLPDIFADKQRIYLVFRNLVLNAINYGGKNIEIGYEHKKGFYVKDDGIGIKNEFINRIFLPGERLKEIKSEGTGMGLTFCKKILELHRGNIWAESEGKGKGTTFYFNLQTIKDSEVNTT